MIFEVCYYKNKSKKVIFMKTRSFDEAQQAKEILKRKYFNVYIYAHYELTVAQWGKVVKGGDYMA